jgi:hypothetical protein
MTAYQEFMAIQIAEGISSITDPAILTIVLHAVLAQRCKIGDAKPGTCKECKFRSNYCREIYRIAKDEENQFLGVPDNGEQCGKIN